MKIAKIAAILLAFFGIASAQAIWDEAKPATPEAGFEVPLAAIKAADLGLHSAAASFLWLGTMHDLVYVQSDSHPYFRKLDIITDLDPRFSWPYAHTVLVLPLVKKYEKRFARAVEIGRRGVAAGVSDWRVPFYTAVIYHADLKDKTNAAKYFTITAEMANTPPNIRSVSLNYGIQKTAREETKRIWKAIYLDAQNDFLREQAKHYLVRLEIFDLLEAAAERYRERFGRYPQKLPELVTAKILTAVPADPFGFELYISEEGEAKVRPPEVVN